MAVKFKRGYIICAAWGIIGLSVFFGAENFIAKSYSYCITQEGHTHSTDNANKSRFIVGRFLEGQAVCSVRFLDAHSGLIAAIAGIFIAGFTYTLWRSTNKLWFAGRDQLRTARQAMRIDIAATKSSLVIAGNSAKAAADSVELARDEFNATHRPKIFVQRISDFWDGRDNKPAFIEVAIVNGGDSPAYVTEFLGTIYIQDADSAFQPNLRPHRSKKFSDRRLGVGEWDTLKIEVDDTSMFYVGFAQQSKDLPIEKSIRLYGMGSVTYRGDDGTTRQTGFCREYSQRTGAWSAVKESEYEYAY